VHYGSTDAIQVLLRHCPDVTEMVDIYGRNVFHASVVYDKVNSLKFLLGNTRSGARKVLVNRVDNEGNTPLHLAVKLGRPQACQLLLGDPLLDPCVLNREGQTARSLIESQKEMHSHTVLYY
jgi:ankyrin repeat protein